jgi:hypothetical protein
MQFSDLITLIILLSVALVFYQGFVHTGSFTFIILLGVTCFLSLGAFSTLCKNGTDTSESKKTFTMWNRSVKKLNKTHWKVINFRTPNIHLPSEEYANGVQLAKANACHKFDLNIESDIDRFRRCAYFFPEFFEEYVRDYQKWTGVKL